MTGFKHGGWGTRLYVTWRGIRQRCFNPTDSNFPAYGGVGIGMDSAWAASFDAFREWAVANGYDDTLTIDRKDNDLGYSPDNCRWTTRAEQGKNRRVSLKVIVGGKDEYLSDLSRRTGIHLETLRHRILRLGWSGDRAISEPLKESSRRRTARIGDKP